MTRAVAALRSLAGSLGPRPLARPVVPLLVVSLAVGLAACTSGDQPAPASPSTEPTQASSGAAVSLSFGVYGDDDTVQAYRDLAEAYVREHPDVRIVIRASDDAEQAATKVRQSTGAGTAPDLFLLDSQYLAELVGTKTLQPVDELMAERDLQFGDDFQRLGFTAFSADQSLQCMPVDVSPLVVFYNPDLLDLSLLNAAEPAGSGEVQTDPGGAPQESPSPTEGDGDQSPGPGEEVSPETGWSWEELVSSAQQASAAGVQGIWVPPDLDVLTPLVRSEGGEVVDEVTDPTTLTLSGEEAATAVGKVLSLVRNPVLTPTPSQIAASDAVTRFVVGRLAMLVGTRADVPALREAGVRFDVMPLPSLGRFRSFSRVVGMCLAASGEHVDAAADFVAWAVGADGSALLARSGAVVPSNVEVLHSDDFLQPGHRPRHAEVFPASVVRSDPGPYSAQWPTVGERADRALRRLYHDLTIDPATGAQPFLERLDQRSARWFAGPDDTASGS